MSNETRKMDVDDLYGLICTVLLIGIIIFLLVVGYNSTKKYSIKLNATKTSEVSNEVPGKPYYYQDYYVDADGIVHSNVVWTKYITTYEYSYDGNVYFISKELSKPGPESVSIYIDPSNPEDWILSESKVFGKE